MGVNLIAAAWGLAEATLFFLVPDIWMSIVGRKKLRFGLVASIYGLVGALIGGTALYMWGIADLQGAKHMIDKVPAVSPAMIVKVSVDLSRHGAWSILTGPLSGTPYKVYAAQAATSGIGLWSFLLISIPARLLRFVLVTAICHYALKFIGRSDKDRQSLWLLISGWILFYSLYFTAMAGK